MGELDVSRGRSTDWNRISTILGAVQSVSIVVGVIVGGIWGYKVFDWTGQKQLAELQILNLQAQTNASITWTRNVDATQLNYPRTGPRFLRIRLTAHATGNYQADVNSHDVRFKVQRVLEIDPDGTVWIDENSTRLTTKTAFCTTRVFPGETELLSKVQQVDAPGMYAIYVLLDGDDKPTYSSFFNVK